MVIIEIPEFFLWVWITLFGISLVLEGVKLYYSYRLRKAKKALGEF